MQGCSSDRRRSLWLWGILGAALVAATPMTASGATRVVLGEEFTNTG
ncbi:MAG: hypothetical protein PVJ57_09670 [Phycisphaerae bacterium]